MPTESACRELGISRSTLYRLRMNGLLEPGAHFHRCGLGGSGKLLWNLPSVRLRLQSICWG